LWPHTHESLDNSLALFAAGLKKLKAAQSVDIAEVVDQLRTAAEAARNLRSLVLSAKPDSSWHSREEFDELVARVQKISEDCARLQALAMELEAGAIVHRRALRVEQVNHLREEAISELRSHAQPGGEPPTLPGPETDHWVKWACALKEPEDASALQGLRSAFPAVDDFIANLEPDMFVGTKVVV
jgi:flagellar biosynthesis/type III secretory pathway chaperone